MPWCAFLGARDDKRALKLRSAKTNSLQYLTGPQGYRIQSCRGIIVPVRKASNSTTFLTFITLSSSYPLTLLPSHSFTFTFNLYFLPVSPALPHTYTHTHTHTNPPSLSLFPPTLLRQDLFCRVTLHLALWTLCLSVPLVNRANTAPGIVRWSCALYGLGASW